MSDDAKEKLIQANAKILGDGIMDHINAVVDEGEFKDLDKDMKAAIILYAIDTVVVSVISQISVLNIKEGDRGKFCIETVESHNGNVQAGMMRFITTELGDDPLTLLAEKIGDMVKEAAATMGTDDDKDDTVH